ncbi:TetR/AcrR family transcriptional regulator [Nitrospirillum viridazoti]|uniref:TetR family transcriptional regulator n=1 Tax=Nitrospirillum viridazoti CBAmc TaxID=1441467 RepID=A0A248K2N7_9PROT|nr:TetR/AcrR family transcriptional regulator [Nitrospirillum amazonense]ASG24684.1 TetR family transcriptional regulator [Nitrospirillum amazonense CBAmc]TWB36945.1 TetR family transcriptional regulator [Nitrospirillum amazonense]
MTTPARASLPTLTDMSDAPTQASPAADAAPAPKLGRRAEARRIAMMDAALKVFMEKGFERATLGDIVALSGGSRATLYELFGGKEGLFLAVLEVVTGHISQLMNDIAESCGPPEEVLLQFGTSLLEALVQPDVMAMNRILVAEGRLFPDQLEGFFRTGPDQSREKVANYLRRAADQGLIVVDDPITAARIFFGMVTAGYSFEGQINPARLGDAAYRHTYVQQVVHLFLHGLCPR